MTENPDIRPLPDMGVAAIMARRGVGARAIGDALGVTALETPGWRAAGGIVLISTGPGAWLARAAPDDPFWAEGLRARLQGLASVSDQSGGYCWFCLSGSQARTVIQRGAAIDFDASQFSSGSAAVTAIAHIGVIILQLEDAPVFEIGVPRSFKAAFRRWLCQTAATLRTDRASS